MSNEINKENVQVESRIPLKTISNQSMMFKRGHLVKESLKPTPVKIAKSKSTQTEVHYSDAGCGTSDRAAEDMVAALTGGPLNETYYEGLAEQRREALEITLDENEDLYKQIEELNISLSEASKRAEEAEYQLKELKSKISQTSPLDLSREEEDDIKSLLTAEQE